MTEKKMTTKKNGAKKITKVASLPVQQNTPFKFKAKPGTYEAILEAAAFAKKAGLKNYARP